MEFSQIAILLVIAAGAGVVAKSLKQPLIIGYLFAGVALGALGLIHDPESFENLGKVGVALLLFLVGLEMNVKELPSLGKTALSTGLGQIIFTSLIGYGLAMMLGFPPLAALYIAIALTFSSTIIIVKLLSEKNELGTLHGQIALGFLLVQDFVAIILLIVLASIGNGTTSPEAYFEIAVKTVLLLGVLYALSVKVLPQLFSEILSSSGELILISSMAWALGLAAFVGGPLGLSLEIGGFLAGLTLSNLPEHLQIASKTRPLRDFFLAIFFLILGTNLVIHNLAAVLVPAMIFSLFVLIGNPLILLIIMGVLGYKKRTSLSVSLTAAQISEFSLIVMSMGLAIGHVTQNDVAIVVLVGVITMTISTYMILGNAKIYTKLEKFLSLFERNKNIEDTTKDDEALNSHIILVGADRTGTSLLGILKKLKHDVVVVDFNPVVIKRLKRKKVRTVFGDINDSEIDDAVGLKNAKMIISTSSRLQDSLLLLENLKGKKNKPLTILKASTIKDAVMLYEKGATYVIQPEIVAGEHIRHLLQTYGVSTGIEKLGESHLRRLLRTL